MRNRSDGPIARIFTIRGGIVSLIFADQVRTIRIPVHMIELAYVPVKRRKTLNSKIVREIAESMLEVGQQIPILVRVDGDRFVLVEGLHRLEACKELGEATIVGYLVRARPY